MRPLSGEELARLGESDTVVVARPLTMDERPNVTVPFEEIQRKWLDKLMGRTPRT